MIIFNFVQKNMKNSTTKIEIKEKINNLIKVKTAYNELIKNTDKEFTEKINQLNEQSVHVPLNLAKLMRQALIDKKTNTKEFRDYVKQFSELINYVNSDDSTNENISLPSSNDGYYDEEEIMKSDKIKASNINSLNTNSHDDSDNISLSDDDEDDDLLHNLESIQLDMKQYISQNYDVQDDFGSSSSNEN